MKRYAVVYGILLVAMLVLFGVAEALEVPLLADPQPLAGQTRLLAAATGVTLLVIDVALPVPSSVAMIAHGAIFGIALGSLLSMAGSLGAFAAAFALGRRGAGVVARLVPDDERARADRFLRRWGFVAIILSRPFPMLAETVAFAAGGSSMRWRPALGAAVLASLPMAGAYATTGAAAANMGASVIVFLAVAVVAVAAGLALKPSRVACEGRP